MEKKIISISTLSIVSLIFAQMIVAQTVSTDGEVSRFMDNSTSKSRSIGSNEILIGKALPPTAREGTYYLNKDWVKGKITLINEEILEDVPIKYHIENNQFEVRLDEEERIIGYDGSLVKNYSTVSEFGVNQFFIYCNKCEFSGTLKNGLFEVIAEGKVSVLKNSRVSIKQSTYVPGKDMGERAEKILIIEEYYLKEDNSLKRIRNNSKWNLSLFPTDSRKKISSFAKENKLSFRKTEDLIKITAYYNTLN